MTFSEGFLEELVSRSDIADVVSGYVTLTKRSGANQFGLCPFHSEKTPSFSVNRDKQIYHCFGCGKGGGVINFIMEIENLSYPDAVRLLARRAGMDVPEDGDGSQRQQRKRILELNRHAARWFHDNLKKPEGAAVLRYIDSRGIRPMVNRFGLGAAPNSWDALIRAMAELGYEKYDLINAGLVVKSRKDTGIYDRFRNRLIFPVIDLRGDVVGFGGRMINPEDSPKYLNSPDTQVFSKGRVLFGMNLVKNTRRPNIILCEGNIDVITLHQAGFDNAVAGMGTALTAEQARMLSRYTSDVILCYDSDGAGQKAAQRSIDILSKTDLHLRVLSIPGAKDPDEFIRENGAAAFETLINKSENHIEYRLLTIKGKYDLTQDEQRVDYARAAAAMIATLDGAVERDIYSSKVADEARISPDAVKMEVEHLRKLDAGAKRKKEQRSQLDILRAAQPRDRELHYDDPISAGAEKGIIRILMLDPAAAQRYEAPRPEDFSSPFLRRVYELLLRRISQGMSVTVTALMNSGEFSAAENAELSAISQMPETLSAVERSLADYTNRIKTQKLTREAGAEGLSSLLRAKRNNTGG